MARVRFYTVHTRRGPWSPSDLGGQETIFVKDGFAWGAFLFTAVWALWRRMWLAALVMLAGSLALGLVSDLLDMPPAFDAAVGLAWSLLIGFEANDWRRRSLERRGFVEVAVVSGISLTDAERRFFDATLHEGMMAAPG
jgi:hypothetical protein